MQLLLTASADTYITNKIINNSFRATDANVGKAGTLDLFKLYNESDLASEENSIELSRLLVKFDLTSIRALTASSIDVNSPNFTAKLKLFDVIAGQATPSNFTVVVFPLSNSFDEGIGRDITSFSDLDACNFVTRSYVDGVSVLWHLTGANATGLLGSSNIDVITSGNLGAGVINLGSYQTFVNGNENLEVDVKTVLSATLAGLIPDCGFRISFSGSQETDNKTRFVKRFASRNASNKFKTPVLSVGWDDTVQDHREDIVFNQTGSVFFRNYVRGSPQNLTFGSGNSAVTGNNCLLLKLVKDKLTLYYTGSQHTRGTNRTPVTGFYSASFAVDQFSTKKVTGSKTMIDVMSSSNSNFIEFEAYWMSLDETHTFFQEKLKVNKPLTVSRFGDPAELQFKITNIRQSYAKDDDVMLQVFIFDKIRDDAVFRTPYVRKGLVLSNVYYQIKLADSNTVVIPFDNVNNTTKLSSDGNGMYFNLLMKSLQEGYTYEIDFLCEDFGISQVYRSASGRFRVGN
jgi:hypothetical protein